MDSSGAGLWDRVLSSTTRSSSRKRNLRTAFQLRTAASSNQEKGPYSDDRYLAFRPQTRTVPPPVGSKKSRLPQHDYATACEPGQAVISSTATNANAGKTLLATAKTSRKGLSDCSFCLDSEKCLRYRGDTFIAASDHVYLAAQNHLATSCDLSSETHRDLRRFKNSIIKFLKNVQSPLFDEVHYEHKSFAPIFVEWNFWSKRGWKRSAFQAAGSGPHVTLDVLPLSQEDHDDAMKIIARELQDISSDVTRKNRGVQRVSSDIPLSSLLSTVTQYIYVDFGEEAFLLTIEDDEQEEVSLKDKLDRKFMRSLLQSLYPDDIIPLADAK